MATNVTFPITSTSAKLPINGTLDFLTLTNMTANPVTLHLGTGPAVFGEGIVLPGLHSNFVFTSDMQKIGEIYAITESGASDLAACYF